MIYEYLLNEEGFSEYDAWCVTTALKRLSELYKGNTIVALRTCLLPRMRFSDISSEFAPSLRLACKNPNALKYLMSLTLTAIRDEKFPERPNPKKN